MLYKLKYRDDLLSEKGNVPEEVIIRETISRFINDIPLEELKSLFGFKKEEVDNRPFLFQTHYIEYSLKLNTYMRDMNNLREMEWTPRYSETSSPDKQGRWATVAYIGNKDDFGFCPDTNRRQYFELAWVSRTVIDEEIHFIVSYHFPCNGKRICETLEEAQKEVEDAFKMFIKSCFK